MEEHIFPLAPDKAKECMPRSSKQQKCDEAKTKSGRMTTEEKDQHLLPFSGGNL